jgi:hypothetical protein
MLLREVKMAGAAITVAPVVLRKARLDSLDGESGVLSLCRVVVRLFHDILFIVIALIKSLPVRAMRLLE